MGEVLSFSLGGENSPFFQGKALGMSLKGSNDSTVLYLTLKDSKWFNDG